MRFLRHRQLRNPEIQDNFEDVETALSEFQLDDKLISVAPEGAPKKVALKDSTGKTVGFVAVYPA